MRYPSVSQLLLSALLSWTTDAQTITIFRTHNMCTRSSMSSSISAPRPMTMSTSRAMALSSTSTIASSVVLSPSSSPSPIDQAIATGAPFTIAVYPVGQPFRAKRVASSKQWLSRDGSLTADYGQAAVFALADGQLFADTWLESTDYNTPNQVFAASASDTVGPITRVFRVRGGVIQWIHPNFEGGQATFYTGLVRKDSPTKRQTGTSVLYARFFGTPEVGWTMVSLGAGLVNNSASSVVSSAPATYSSSVASSPSAASSRTVSSSSASPTVFSLSSVVLGSPSSAVVSPSSTAASSSSQPISSTSSSAMASGTLVSYNGLCGPKNYMLTCSGSAFGSCCGSFGNCGSSDSVCGAGCQPGFGACNAVSSSASLSSTMSSVVIPSSSSIVAPPSSSPLVSASGFSSSASVSSISSMVMSSSAGAVVISTTSSSTTIRASSSTTVATSSSFSSSTLGILSSSSMSTTSSVSMSMSVSMASLVSSSSRSSSTSSPVLVSSSMSASSSQASSMIIASSSSPVQSTVTTPTGPAPTCTNLDTVICPQNNGSYYNNAKVECSINYAAGNIAGTGATAPALTDCIDRCVATATCVGGNWLPGPKNCYLKMSIGAKTANAGVQGFILASGSSSSGSACAAAGSGNSPVASTMPTTSTTAVSSQVASSSQSLVSRSSSSTTSSSVLSSVVSSSVAAMSSMSTSTTSSVSQIPISTPMSSSSSPGSFSPTQSSTSSSVSATPSSKRGLVYVPSSKYPNDDFTWVQPGSPMNWYYNYGYRPSARWANDRRLQFVPMLFGDFTNNFTATVVQQIQSGLNVSHVMAFNEPDGPYSEGGSQVTPANGAARWLQDIEPLRAYGVSLGAPAVTGSQRGFQWLQQFFTACAGRCHADFVSVHWYGSFQGLASEIGQMRSTYPNMTIWVTEFADAHVDLATSQTVYNSSISYLDRLAYVNRYSYFGAFRSDVSNVGSNATFLDQCGQLTDIGAWYLNLPNQAMGVQPASTTCTISTTSTSTMTMASSSSASSNGPISLTSTQTRATSSTTVSSSTSTMISSTVVSTSVVYVSPSPSPSASSTASTCTGQLLHIPAPATPVPSIACMTSDQDDFFGSVTLPLSVKIYSIVSNRIFVSTNGLLTLNVGSSQYDHQSLPASNFDPGVNGILFPLWTDLKMDASPSGDGVFYFANATFFAAEWFAYAAYDVNQRFQFSVEWSSATPNVWAYRYYRVADSGASATVGIQGGLSGPSAQFSMDQALVPAGTKVSCDTALGSCVASSFDVGDEIRA